jgi:hypothetical protein
MGQMNNSIKSLLSRLNPKKFIEMTILRWKLSWSPYYVRPELNISNRIIFVSVLLASVIIIIGYVWLGWLGYWWGKILLAYIIYDNFSLRTFNQMMIIDVAETRERERMKLNNIGKKMAEMLAQQFAEVTGAPVPSANPISLSAAAIDAREIENKRLETEQELPDNPLRGLADD